MENLDLKHIFTKLIKVITKPLELYVFDVDKFKVDNRRFETETWCDPNLKHNHNLIESNVFGVKSQV